MSEWARIYRALNRQWGNIPDELRENPIDVVEWIEWRLDWIWYKKLTSDDFAEIRRPAFWREDSKAV